MNIDTQTVHDLVTRQIDLLRYERSVRRDVLRQLANMQAEVVSRLKRNDLSDLNRRELNALLADIETILSRDYDLIASRLKTEQVEAVQDESIWLWAWLAALAVQQNQPEPKPLSETAMKSLSDGLLVGGLTLSEAVAGQKAALMQQIKQAVRVAAVSDGADVVADVAGLFKRKARDLTAVTATWIGTLSAEVHYAFGKVNPLVKGFRHVSVLDGKTSSICTARHGLVWDKQHNPIGHSYPFRRPALHPHCRSKLVFVFDLDSEFDGVTGEDWVKGRTLEQLQEQFGKGVGEMLHRRIITLNDAVRSDGLQAATLDELKRKYDPVYIVPSVDTSALQGARFTQSQLKRKFKHAADFGIDTRKPDPKNWKVFQDSVIAHLDDKNTVLYGSYRVKGSKVFYNKQTDIAVVFADNNTFITAMRINGKQREHYLENGYLQ